MSYTLLELLKITRAESIGLGDDRNQIDTSTKALHNFNVERLKGVASRSDEVEAGVDTEVNLIRTTGLLLLKHVGLVLVVQELDDGAPRITVVDIVAETRCINNSQADCS